MKVSQSSTSNLYQHLERHHPAEYSAVAPSASTRSAKRKLTLSASDGQKKLFDMLPFDNKKEKHKELVRAVAKYITSGTVPIYTVDKPAFRNLLHQLEPRFTCPSRKYFTTKAIPEMYNDMKGNLVSDLKNVKYYSCTMDGWSSIAGDPYLSLTIHYIDNNWQLVTKCLSTMYVPQSHTAETLFDFVIEGLRDYDLDKDNMAYMTTDSAANNVAACRRLSIDRISCFGHILHNALTTAMNADEEIIQLMKAARRIVSVFSYSHESRKKLAKIKKHMNNDAKALVQDVATRWGSKYKMLSRLHAQIKPLNELFINCRKHRDLILSSDQSDLLSMLVVSLEPFSQLTDALSGDQAVTISSLVPMLVKIQGICSTPEDAEPIKKLKKNVWSYMSSKFDSTKQSSTTASIKQLNLDFAAATLLDRRYSYR